MIRRSVARSYSTLKTSSTFLPKDGLTFQDFVRPQADKEASATIATPPATSTSGTPAVPRLSYFIETYGCQVC